MGKALDSADGADVQNVKTNKPLRPEKEGMGSRFSLVDGHIGKVAAKSKNDIERTDEHDRSRPRMIFVSQSNIKVAQWFGGLLTPDP
ncbi:hypothetical protein APSETT445_003857 [Aspergillus pseudonomiae]